ncbi:hypothetical protein SAMD00019534_012840, partial [Acytostelium subglobosum LB1]|uniref:hypothetical protein n=1 Tax=Acytostelium subglobosum LB1 TaxID=1410327 RepID=UPI0006449B9D
MATLPLPPFLTTLTLGVGFKRLIEPGMLPMTLTDLTLGPDFCQPLVQDALPITLSRLELQSTRKGWTHCVCLPSRLKTLVCSVEALGDLHIPSDNDICMHIALAHPPGVPLPDVFYTNRLMVDHKVLYTLFDYARNIQTFVVNVYLHFNLYQYILRRIDQHNALWISGQCPNSRPCFVSIKK